jgi:hypothetical protein
VWFVTGSGSKIEGLFKLLGRRKGWREVGIMGWMLMMGAGVLFNTSYRLGDSHLILIQLIDLSSMKYFGWGHVISGLVQFCDFSMVVLISFLHLVCGFILLFLIFRNLLLDCSFP